MDEQMMDDEEQKKKATLEDYLKNKYEAQGLGDEKRAELDAKVTDSEPAGWRKSLVAAGAVMAGNDAGSAVRSLYTDQENARKNLVDFENRREKVMGNIGNEQKFQNMQRDDATLQREMDPNSQESKTAQALASKMMPGKDFSNATAAQLKTSIPTMEKMYNIEQNRLARQDTLNASKSDKTKKEEEKKVADQAKAYTDLRSHLENFRGNQAAQQASKDVYSAGKALELVSDRDPNELTTQDLTLLSNEIGKIASGGIPGEHGVQAMMPNTMRTKYAEMQSFLSGKPSDAEAGEFVKRNMKYLKGMVGESKKVLKTYRNSIAKGYKGRVSQTDYDEAVNDYQLNAPDYVDDDKKKTLHADDLPEIN